MKVSILKTARKKEVINRIGLAELAELIRTGGQQDQVKDLRLHYHLMKPRRLEDGQIGVDDDRVLNLPRLCFAMELRNKDGRRQMTAYNGLVVLEVNGLKSYEEAVTVRNSVSRLPQTLMAFLGASGKSVKIVVRGELFPDSRRKDEEIAQFHLNIYRTARQAYQSQFGLQMEYMDPRLDRFPCFVGKEFPAFPSHLKRRHSPQERREELQGRSFPGRRPAGRQQGFFQTVHGQIRDPDGALCQFFGL